MVAMRATQFHGSFGGCKAARMGPNFYRKNAWWLGTGLLLNFASTFGQTYFIALSGGGIRAEFGLSNGEWGGIYTIATIMSAATLILIGRFADTVALVRLAVIVFAIYALAAVLMMNANSVVMLALAIYGLRFCGQGMMVLLSMTAMARWFAANRARAVAITVLGFPLGEALFPFAAVQIQALGDWRTVWGVVAVFVAFVVLPAAFVLLRQGRTPQNEGAGDSAVGMGGRHWTRGEVLRHWSFYALLPGILAAPFIGTCAMFHQVHIAAVHGFDLKVMALAFPVYAATSVISSLTAGSLIDRIGPTRMLPFMVLPLGIGVAALALPGGVWIWFAVLAGVAMSQGIAVTMMGALWPTLYGTRSIGSVKAILSAAMVAATAIGPGITGFIIDAGVTFPEQALFMSAYCVAMAVLFAFVAPRLRAELPPVAAAHPA